MKKLHSSEVENLVLKLFNKNRLIAVLNKNNDTFYIYYYENSDIIELEVDTGCFAGHTINNIATSIQNMANYSNNVFYELDDAVILLNNINQKMIDNGYLKLDIDESDLDESEVINIKFIFPNSKCRVFISYEYLTSNIIELFSLETIKKAISIKNKLKNDYLNILNTTFNFVDERIKNLSDEEKLYLKL